jgi:apolipoprotein N-acyltransferase
MTNSAQESPELKSTPASTTRASLRSGLPSLGTLASAVLYVLAFAPWNFSGLTWFALVPFLATLRGQPTRKALVQSMWLGMLITLMGFPWVAYVLAQFGGLPLWLGVVGLFAFGLICQPQFWWVGPLWARLPRTPKGGLLLFEIIGFAAFYAGLDWLLPKLFVDTLGHAFYRNEWIRQAAELGGPPLLTWSALLWNLTAAHAWIAIREIRSGTQTQKFGTTLRQALLALREPIAIASVVSLGILLYGRTKQTEWSDKIARAQKSELSGARKIRASVIQANIGDYEKVAAETGAFRAADKIIESYVQLSDLALADPSGKPELLIWPETAYPTTFRTPRTPRERHRDQVISDFQKSRGVPLIFGGYDRSAGKDFNSLFILGDDRIALENPEHPTHQRLGSDLIAYHKNILLLFGEEMPLADRFPILNEWFPQVGNFGKGPGAEVLRVPLQNAEPPLKVAPIICYEALFTRYTTEASKKGAELLLNVTNDSWFGPLGEPELHLALTTFRSIETRLPQVRSTNTGISALILQDGSLAAQGPKNEVIYLNWDIPLIPNAARGPLIHLGDWFGPLAFALGTLSLIGLYRRRRT